jgi:hypothetical protein
MTRGLFAIFILVFSSVIAFGQANFGTLRGRVVDNFGAVIVGAEVTAVNQSGGAERRAQTNQAGEFSFNLAVGRYVVRVVSRGFAIYENAEVEVSTGRTPALDITLNVAQTEAEVTVGEESPVNTNPENNASALVLKDADIEALPDNDADLEAALRALAGPGAGPNGGEFFVDGFSGGRIPPRNTIREIRINQNPFSSEYDRLGFGRIEILTKPGTDDFRGEVEFEFEDEALNSRNPFSQNRAAFQVREFSANIGGPLVKKRASYFVDFEYGDTANNSLINAVVLDSNLNNTTVQFLVATPTREFEFSPRFDFQINETNTLVARYEYSRENSENSGLGGFDLPSRGFVTRGSEHSIRLTETAVINGSIINETRFQYIRRRNSDESEDASPTIRVLDAFTAGGANIGFAFSNEDRIEFQNYTSLTRGRHALKFGARVRNNRLDNSSPANFAGTFTFTSLDQYRDTILSLPGARPSQFTIAGGEPQANISQTDAGLFVQDDWRVNQQLTLSWGLRYENQTNISSNFNLAPRFGFAFSPGANGQKRPKTVFRGGFGIFYDRFGENLSLQARRFNGVNQLQFLVTDPDILDDIIFTPNGVSNVPTVTELSAFNQPQTTRIVSPDLQAPYTIQTALSVERQLPFKTTFSATYINAQTRRLLRSRNVNAPVGGVRPNPSADDIFQYESTGRFSQNQLIFNVRSNFVEGVSIFANYALSKAKSDTDGAGSFPANSFDLTGEYSDAALDIRHRFVIGGNFKTFWGIGLSPFITFRSGVPFNITTGTDDNGDSIFNHRPTFAQLAAACGERGYTNSFCNIDGRDPNAVIPRNYGRGSEFFMVNLRLSKEFGFGGKKENQAAQTQVGSGGGNRGGINSPFGGGGGGRGGGRDDDESPYTLEFSVQIRNLFNRTNKGTPVGNLRSNFFGAPTSLGGGFGLGGGGGGQAGNRRVEFDIEFSF